METKLVKKLQALQCDCDALEGKTVKKAIRFQGFYYLLFFDGTWCHTDYRIEAWEMLETLQHEDPLNDPFLEFELATHEELHEHWDELDAMNEERGKEQRRKQYEALKEEFQA